MLLDGIRLQPEPDRQHDSAPVIDVSLLIVPSWLRQSTHVFPTLTSAPHLPSRARSYYHSDVGRAENRQMVVHSTWTSKLGERDYMSLYTLPLTLGNSILTVVAGNYLRL